MEKDFFQDRIAEVCNNDEINIGDLVFICLKEDQPTAEDINDLVLIKVNQKLTPIDFHPRGIKVSGKEIDFFSKNFSFKEQSGRVTYKMNTPYSIKTSDGTMAISRSDDSLKIVSPDTLYDKKRVVLWFGVLGYSFSLIMDPFTYTSETSTISDRIIISSASLSRNHITYTFEGIGEVMNFNVNAFSGNNKFTLGDAFLSIRSDLNGQFGVTGYSTIVPIRFLGISFASVKESDFIEK